MFPAAFLLQAESIFRDRWNSARIFDRILHRIGIFSPPDGFDPRLLGLKLCPRCGIVDVRPRATLKQSEFLMSIKHDLLKSSLLAAALAFAGCMEAGPVQTDPAAQPVLSAATATAPAITRDPADLTTNVGSIYTFTVSASGTAPLAYQWLRNGAHIAGANGPSYSKVSHLQDSGAVFRCIVSNSAGSDTSNGARPKVLLLRYQAENATLSGAVAASNQPGFTGTGFADYINATGDFVKFNTTVGNAGSYTLVFFYANGGGTSRPLKLEVNGITVNASLAFASTGSWGTWKWVNVAANLAAGTNTVKLTAIGASGGNIDRLDIE
jgi:hypothetical protein